MQCISMGVPGCSEVPCLIYNTDGGLGPMNPSLQLRNDLQPLSTDREERPTTVMVIIDVTVT